VRLCKASYALFSKRFIGAIIGRNLCVPKLYKREVLEFIEKLIGRSERIRTSDPLLPKCVPRLHSRSVPPIYGLFHSHTVIRISCRQVRSPSVQVHRTTAHLLEAEWTAN